MKLPRRDGTVRLLVSIEPGRVAKFLCKCSLTNQNFDIHRPLLMSPDKSSENYESIRKSFYEQKLQELKLFNL